MDSVTLYLYKDFRVYFLRWQLLVQLSAWLSCCVLLNVNNVYGKYNERVNESTVTAQDMLRIRRSTELNVIMSRTDNAMSKSRNCHMCDIKLLQCYL